MRSIKLYFLCFAFLGIYISSHSQWNTSGNDINNTNSGNVGIGTSSPAVKFHVAGAVRIEGGISSITGSGTYNERFGMGSLSSLALGGSYNTAIGYNAMNLYNSANGANTAIGYNVLSKTFTGGGNTGIGFNTLAEYVGSVGYNTAIGYAALQGTSGSFTGYYNVGIGYQSGLNVTSGYANTFIGPYAGHNVTTGHDNTVIGSDVMSAASSYNVVVGAGSSSGSGNFNVAIGVQAGNITNLTGSNNLFMGYVAGSGITSGTGNVFLGYGAAGTGRTSQNIIIGNGAGGSITTGGGADVWIGSYTGENVKTSSESVIVGDQAAYSSNNTTNAVLLGKSAGSGGGTLPSVANSVIIGRSAYQYAQNGSNSVAIGAYAGYNPNSSDMTGNVFIGFQSGWYQNVSNRLFIENSNSANPLIYGEFDNRIVKINNKLFVSSLVTSGTAPTTSGTTKMVVTDANGQLSFKDEPSGGGSSNAWSYSGNSGTSGSTNFIGTTDLVDFAARTNNIERMRITSGGNIGIGTTDPGPYKLAVEGTMAARKVKVTQVNPWADYVFNDDYHLMSLKELDTYIHKYRHLPDVPSAKEVEANGLDLGDNQAILLKKIEELTLYIIEMNKKVEKLAEENAQMKRNMVPKK